VPGDALVQAVVAVFCQQGLVLAVDCHQPAEGVPDVLVAAGAPLIGEVAAEVGVKTNSFRLTQGCHTRDRYA